MTANTEATVASVYHRASATSHCQGSLTSIKLGSLGCNLNIHTCLASYVESKDGLYCRFISSSGRQRAGIKKCASFQLKAKLLLQQPSQLQVILLSDRSFESLF